MAAISSSVPIVSGVATPLGVKRAARTVLLIDHNQEFQEYVKSLLGPAYVVRTASSERDALDHLESGADIEAVMIDCYLPDFGDGTQDGLSLLSQIRELRPKLPVVMLSCADTPSAIVKSMRLGARDFLVKPFRREELLRSLDRCFSIAQRVSVPVAACEIPIGNDNAFVFGSAKMKQIHATCASIARVDLPVLILGESGTGKEVISHLIHKMSPRAHRTFMKINCAAMPADLLESELFGYEQGAFTGAVKAKPGKFELCNHGTLFLDEIGEMPPALQAKLLQVLQDGSFSRLGGRTTVQVDVRVVAATNIDMRAAIAEKTFRPDLYYRLNGFSIHLPPLRERREEIPTLMEYFVRKLGPKYAKDFVGVSDEMLNTCMSYPWPGNLRELENFVKRLLVLGDEQLMLAELRTGHPNSQSATKQMTSDAGGLKKLVRNLKGEAESEMIAASLNRHGWNRRRTAEELSISYKALLYKIRQYGIEPPTAVNRATN